MGAVVEPSNSRFWWWCRDMSNNSLSGQIPQSFGLLDLLFMWVETCIRCMCELQYTIVINVRDHTSMYQTLHIHLYWRPWPRGDVDTICFYSTFWHCEDTENTLLWVLGVFLFLFFLNVFFLFSDIWMTMCWMEASPTLWGTAQISSICECNDVPRVLL